MRDLFGLTQRLLVVLIFVPFERLFAARPQKIFRRGLLTDMAFPFINAGLVLAGVIAIMTAAILVNQSILPAAVTQAIGDLPYLVQVPLVIQIADLGVYWTHGALFPVYALGFSIEAIGAYLLVYYWQAWLVHANVRLNHGPLRHVLVSPEFHHWHHSSETAARDKNFAGLFSFYDVLFGSTYLPKGQNPKAFGVDHPMPSSYLALLAYPFVAWTAKRKRDDPSAIQPLSNGGKPAQPRQSAPLS
ncbi:MULTISPECIES: sterol desaturase family protein [unclassified Bradyrhizobium]|uniref:sterol desaturase family protein n=1 Tax=unclassified Bradyrhizobium TaxID=2631580 RepID=UPI001BAA2467|nr:MULTISPECIES: sterol desaturase family protein [unclassified Bradyrhizobium]MBR1204698.1 sterol desaturase family protein [Bradyrhizobium sp. AUGA SZCCT0124]MBR1309416.1 sterol desaturase family protein [Bradyrhizobium sp. AUGA SZCCT0051]MBR1342337.1 sterol desaturase family protein [Bradyrhizobium sp. AUGA SZCCT0105]MBR1354164.1 sterol desaturase family protein [Bradyrhizobium sp. AUGA SZCCT0045]